MKGFSALEKISMKAAQLDDNDDWNDTEEVQELTELIKNARQEGYNDKQIETAIKRRRLYVKNWID